MLTGYFFKPTQHWALTGLITSLSNQLIIYTMAQYNKSLVNRFRDYQQAVFWSIGANPNLMTYPVSASQLRLFNKWMMTKMQLKISNMHSELWIILERLWWSPRFPHIILGRFPKTCFYLCSYYFWRTVFPPIVKCDHKQHVLLSESVAWEEQQNKFTFVLKWYLVSQQPVLS